MGNIELATEDTEVNRCHSVGNPRKSPELDIEPPDFPF